MQSGLVGHVALVTDTNLFLECRTLSDIPWQELGYATIDLIVTRPVQQELDAHKKNSRGRTFKRALAAAQQLRTLVTSGDEFLVLKEDKPRVTLRLMKASRIEPDLGPALDPQVNDDAIILRMLQFQRDNAGTNVQLLTHDTGPMATAQSLSLPFIPISESWLLNEQDDPSTKEIKKLESEIKRLQMQEPHLRIEAFDEAGNNVARIDTKLNVYEPLTTTQIEAVMAELEALVPMETDFGSPDTTPKSHFPALPRQITVTEFKPAPEHKIEEYRSKRYPVWLSDCRTFLEKLHLRLNARVKLPAIVFQAQNTGTRPATRCLIRFMALGDLRIELPPNDEGDNGATSKPIDFPRPPTPPRGKWVSSPRGISAGLAAMMMGRENDPFGARVRHLDALNLPQLSAYPRPRDPDRFYWRDGRPSVPKTEIGLTCENWRHCIEPELFELWIDGAIEGNVRGAIKCEIHSENLTDPVQLAIPVTITFVEQSTQEVAYDLLKRISPHRS